MHVDFQKTDALNAVLTVKIPREEYESKYKTALLDYRKKASFKGFRKGKTPVAYLEKLFGQEVLTRTVTDLITDAVNQYLEEQKVPFIGQPLPAKEQEPVALDPKALEDEYTYTFDIGLLPDFDIKGLDDEIEWYDVPVSEDQVEHEWSELLKRRGSYVPSETVDAESRIQMRFREMENLGPKPDGRENTTFVFPENLKDDIKEGLIGKKVGDIIRFDPNHFLKRGDLEMFKRYYLDVDDDNVMPTDQIEGQILSLSALKPAEPDEEFFNSAFEPGTVSSEEEARDMIRKVLKQRKDAQSDAHLRHMIEHRLIDANRIELPYAFIDRLVEATNGNGDKEKAAPEKQADAFRWHFIKDRLSRKFNIEVSQDEIVRAAADRVYERFGGSLPYERMKEIIERFLSDRDSVDQLRNSVADTKLFYALKEHMPVVKKEVSADEFSKMQEEHHHEH